jgi:imidazolonepropionase
MGNMSIHIPSLVIRSHNIACMNTENGYGLIDGYIAVADDHIVAVEKGEIPTSWYIETNPLTGRKPQIIEAISQTVTPGFIDPHTHLVHAGSRENELTMKLEGVPYLEILEKGGGILSTVRQTREASADELYAKAIRCLNRMIEHGTTTIEAKSGYGLDFDTEVKCLKVAKILNQAHPIDIVSTYLGAHAIPPEFKDNPTAYMDFMLDTVMPYIQKENLAEFFDIFCEDGIFSVEDSRTLMKSAQKLGFKLKMHADEIIPLQGAELAAEMNAISADHLAAASEEGMKQLADAQVTAVLLPGTSFYLMLKDYANARKMLDMGIRVALATDYNPGTCPCENLQAIFPFACMGMKLTPVEIVRAVTLNAAYAIGRENEIGSLEVGKKADINIFDAPNPDYLSYHFGINIIDKVIKSGLLVVNEGKLINVDYNLIRRFKKRRHNG